MFEELEYITTVIEKYYATIYFICRGRRIIFPLEIDIGKMKENMEMGGVLPSTLCTLKSIIRILESKVEKVNLYMISDNIKYAYITINNVSKSWEVNSDFYDAFILAKEFNAPIFVKDEILNEYGIPVSEELIRESLNSGD